LGFGGSSFGIGSGSVAGGGGASGSTSGGIGVWSRPRTRQAPWLRGEALDKFIAFSPDRYLTWGTQPSCLAAPVTPDADLRRVERLLLDSGTRAWPIEARAPDIA
jgi:hypothetical protein